MSFFQLSNSELICFMIHLFSLQVMAFSACLLFQQSLKHPYSFFSFPLHHSCVDLFTHRETPPHTHQEIMFQCIPYHYLFVPNCITGNVLDICQPLPPNHGRLFCQINGNMRLTQNGHQQSLSLIFICLWEKKTSCLIPQLQDQQGNKFWLRALQVPMITWKKIVQIAFSLAWIPPDNLYICQLSMAECCFLAVKYTGNCLDSTCG